MFQEVTMKQALKMLNEDKPVYLFREETCQIANLRDALNGVLIADVQQEPETEPEPNLPAEEVGEPEPETEPVLPTEETAAAEACPEEEKPKGRNKWAHLDWGKVEALRKAKWSVSKIADEMKCPVHVIYSRFKEKGDPIYAV